MVVWVIQGGRSVVADPVVRVRFPTAAVEVVRKCLGCRSDGAVDRKARRDERGPVGHECGLIVCPVRVYPSGIPLTGRDEARSELRHG